MKPRQKYLHLLEDPDVRRWYENVARGSITTAEELSLALRGIMPEREGRAVEIRVLDGPDRVTAVFWDYLSYVYAAIRTDHAPLKKAVFFTDRGVWKEVEWQPAYAWDGASYELWVEKPRDHNETAALYAELTDVWGNSQVVALGDAGPYEEGIYSIPYSGLLKAAAATIGAWLAYELLRKLAERI
ncbi:MAG: hypothetical protein QXZ28_00290 [Candidatus Methanomethylicaceae archaeon]